MNLPDFLVIGSMKAGTTTLFRDLMLNPRVFFPLEKEPERLCHDSVLSDEGLQEYARMFARAKPDQRCAEASTAYTKRPVFEGVPARAREVLGPEARMLYVIRDPIKRIVSQHRHEVAVGKLETCKDINDAVRQISRYIDYSRYAWQLEPWIDTFGPDRVRVIVLERYIRARSQTLEAVSEFLGLQPVLEGIDEGRVFNKADDRRVVRGPWRQVLSGPLYQRVLRPMMSTETRQRLRRVFLPKAAVPQSQLSPETEAWLRDQLAPETTKIVQMLNTADLLLPAGTEPFTGWG